MPPPICTIDFHVDDQWPSVKRFLTRLSVVLNCEKPGSWQIDLRESGYLGPDAASILLATVLEGVRRQQTCEVMLPTVPPKLAAFCEFSGLNHWIRGSPVPDGSHPDNVTVPLRVIRKANFRDADPIIQLVRRHTGISRDSEDYLRLCINEVTQNVEDHSESAIGGVCCARYLAGKHQTRVAIVDRGLGIATTLQGRYPEITDASVALSRVVHGEYTSGARINNAGLGINRLWSAVASLKGDIFIVSEGAVIFSRPTGYRIEPMQPGFPGTGVFFTLPVTAAGDQSHDSYD